VGALLGNNLLNSRRIGDHKWRIGAYCAGCHGSHSRKVASILPRKFISSTLHHEYVEEGVYWSRVWWAILTLMPQADVAVFLTG
jgi:hypothetical protein